MYICMYTCIYVYMYTCIYVYMYTCIHVYMYICIYVYMYICIYVYMYICISIYIYVYVYMCMCICVYVYTHLCIYLYDNNIYVREYVDMMLIMCVCIYIYICVKHHIVAGYLRFAMILSAKTWNLLNPEYGIRCGVKTTHVGQGGSFTSWSIQRLMESINSIAEQIRFSIHFKRFRLTCLQSLHLDGTLGLAEYYCVLLHHTPISTSVLLENLSANHDPPLEKILKVCFYSCTLLAVYFVGLLGIVASGFCIACFFLYFYDPQLLVLMESQLLLFNWPGTFITWVWVKTY